MSEPDFSLIDLFRAEVETHTASLSNGLLALESKPGDVASIEPLMRAAHSVKGAARIIGLDPVVTLAHAMEDCFVAAQEKKITLTPAHVDVLLRGVDFLSKLKTLPEAEITPWLAAQEGSLNSLHADIRQLVEGGTAPATPPPVTTTQVAPSEVTPTVPAAPAATTTAAPAPAHAEGGERAIRITTKTLDQLLGIAAETLVETARLEPYAARLDEIKKIQVQLFSLLAQLRSSLEAGISIEEADDLWHDIRSRLYESNKLFTQRIDELADYSRRTTTLTERLYHQVILSRMRPFREGTTAFPRLVRDLARQLGKNVRLEILGQDTLVDRDSLEKLEAPLGHLIRNALDHGIETPMLREQEGKNPESVLRLEARHHAGMLFVTLSDDGRGIDLARLRAKAIAKGIVPYNLASGLSEAELLEFLFLPGFSTAEKVTEISGRGVGLDVVQSTAQELGGAARVTSRLGIGTTFTLQLPVTRSVIRALLVEISGQPYAFPLARIERTIKTSLPELEMVGTRMGLRINGKPAPLISGADALGLPQADVPLREICVVVIGEQDTFYCIEVDAFLGERRLVVRPLDPRLGKVPDISAASVMEDGRAVLIVDVDDLSRSIESQLLGGNLSRLRQESDVVERKTCKHILVVDDSLTVRELERKLLENAGYKVDCAVDGMEGWNAVRLANYDLVVSDVDMPRMNGIDFVRHIRRDPRLKSLPVVIVSYKDREEDRMKGLDAGANYYLTKSSFHDASLINAVAELIGEANA